MKYLYSNFITSGLVFLLLLAGCARNSDLEVMKSRVDSLESDKIKSIEALVASIQSSVSSLEGTDTSLQNYITQLQKQVADLEKTDGTQTDEIAALQSAIESLKAKDSDLQKQITGLKEYADKLVSDSQTWANATFATLEQYNASAKTISGIQETLTAIDGKIKSTDATLEAHTALLSSIQSSISAMQLDIDTLKTQMSSVLSRIQSIVYVPKYTDGDALVTYTDNGTIAPGLTELDFRVKPENIADEISTLWTADKNILSLTALYTISKSVPEEINLDIAKVTSSDGYLTITASGKGLEDDFFKGKRSALSCLSLSDGNNDLTTAYVRLVPWKSIATDISFADKYFKEYCLQNFDTDSDGKFSDFEILMVTEIDCSNLCISSLEGVQYFKNLENLKCSGNALESLDVTALENLTSLDVSDNQELTNLAITGTPLSSLKVSKQLDCLAGQYVYSEGVAGVVFSVGSDSVRIVSGVETSATYKVGTAWCNGLGLGWEMASSGDCQIIYSQKSMLNSVMSSIGAPEFSNEYWTGTVINGVNYSFSMERGTSNSRNATVTYKVRAVRNL